MSPNSQTFSVIPAALQQWVDARVDLSKAIQAYVNTAAFLESAHTPFSIRSFPEVPKTIERNFEIMEHELLDLQRAQAALKKNKNSIASPIYALPSELMAYIFTTTLVAVSPDESSSKYIRRSLSHVCSRWRRLALEFCPVWSWVSLTLGVNDASKGKLMKTEIGLHDTSGWYIEVPIHRPPRVGETQYAQMTLATIAPYMRQLSTINLNADTVEQLRPFLEFWLEKGVIGSVTTLDLSAKKAASAFPKTNSHLGNDLSQSLRNLESLTLSFVGLDWSSVSFGKLTTMFLSDLPSCCCPTPTQLARILSTCPQLLTLHLERITFPTFLDTAPEPADLDHLQYLYLKEIDIAGVLPIISTKSDKLNLKLPSPIDTANALKSLLSFARRTNIYELDLTLSETRSDQALAQLLHPASSPFLGLKVLMLSNMSLRDSELNELTARSLIQDNAILPPTPADTTGGPLESRTLVMWYCTIFASSEVFRNAFLTLSWHKLMLNNCHHPLTDQGADGATEALVPIDSTSGFSIQLSELLPGRVDVSYW
ncbi:hypothetical protein BDV93DRAFT_524668 [Ceratobasidium sp. AG-I]|nr:hypothetical protein BDV93DRAFT_524668 [Ceratobasidium sp. AG-I]